jgi:hypothetical protein
MKKSRSPAILSVIHHRQNPLEPNYIRYLESPWEVDSLCPKHFYLMLIKMVTWNNKSNSVILYKIKHNGEMEALKLISAYYSYIRLSVNTLRDRKGGRTPTASRQASRHETKKTKADVSIITQTSVRRFSRSHSFQLSSFLCVMSQTSCLDCYMSWLMPVCALPKLCSRLWTIKQFFVSVYRVYSVSTDNICM